MLEIDNRAQLTGVIERGTPPQYDHECAGESFYQMMLRTPRLSGASDVLPLLVPAVLMPETLQPVCRSTSAVNCAAIITSAATARICASAYLSKPCKACLMKRARQPGLFKRARSSPASGAEARAGTGNLRSDAALPAQFR
jgi:hypothetical protein